MKFESLLSRAGYRYIKAAVGATVVAVAAPAWGDSLAGSDEFICAAGHVTVCAYDGSCENTSTADMGIPQFLVVDLKNRKMRTTQASGANRTSDISSQVREGGKVLFQGAQDGRALSANVSEESGDAAIAIVLDSAIIGVFAACTPLPVN